MLGVSAAVVIGHGASTPLAIKNMILEAEHAAKNGLVNKLSQGAKIIKDE